MDEHILPLPPTLETFRFVYRTGEVEHKTDTGAEKMARTLMRESPIKFMEQLQEMERSYRAACVSVRKARAKVSTKKKKSPKVDQGTARALSALTGWLEATKQKKKAQLTQESTEKLQDELRKRTAANSP
jgi:16S rRNA G527 N7-methylase RsmG